jgi:DNA polymerase I
MPRVWRHENSPFSSDYRYMVVDVETTGLDWTSCKLHGMSVIYPGSDPVYHPSWNIPASVVADLENPDVAKVGHNLHGYDVKVLKKFGIKVDGPLDDTMILWNLYDDRLESLGLKYLAEKFLGTETLEAKRALDRYVSEHKAGNIAGLCAQDLLDENRPHTEVIGRYSCEDTSNTESLLFMVVDKLRVLDAKLKGELKLPKSPIDYYHEEARPLEVVLLAMEYRGVRVDLAAVERVRSAAELEMRRLETAITPVMRKRIALCEELLYIAAVVKSEMRGEKQSKRDKLKRGEKTLKFSWGNNNHVGRLLYECCGLPHDLVAKTERCVYRTDKSTFLALRDKLKNMTAGSFGKLVTVLENFAEYKKQQKIASTYTGTAKKGILSKVRYDESGIPYIYPSYRQTTGTGRLASSGPNMQNLKKDSQVKTFFIPDFPETECVDDADYSQIELRTAAHNAGDGVLKQAFIAGKDVHLITASVLFGRPITKEDDLERQTGKRTNFLTIFRGKKHRLQQALLAETGREFSLEQCQDFIDQWFELFPEVARYLDLQLEFFLEHRIAWCETGRIRRIPDVVLDADVDWEYSPGGRSYPRFRGSPGRRAYVVAKVLSKLPDLKQAQVTESMVGREARLLAAHAEKVGYNLPIQGLAASMTKRSMIQLYCEGRRILNQVHDSLCVSRPKDDPSKLAHLVTVMKTAYPLSLPVEVDVKTLRSFHPKDKL